MIVEIRLLGDFVVAVDGKPIDAEQWTRRQAASLLKLLALAPRRSATREVVMAALWPGADRASSSRGLDKMVHFVRHALEPDLGSGSASQFLRRDGGRLELANGESVRIDIDAFRSAATTALEGGDETSCQRAVEAYGGELLPGDRHAEWTEPMRQNLRSLRLQVGLALADALARRGEHEAAVRELRAGLAIDPLAESTHRALMVALAASGLRAQAIEHFKQCEELLRRELDAEPDAATRAVYDRIAAGGAPVAGNRGLPRGFDSVAVLPFANATGDPGYDYLCEGLCESLIRALARSPSWRVMAPSTVMAWRRREQDPRAVGRDLGVALVVLGRIARRPGGLVIHVEVARADDGSLQWGEQFTASEGNLVEVEHAIVGAVEVQLGGRHGRGPATQSALAFEHYLRGRHEWNKRTAASMQAARTCFEAAIDSDPGYALAWVGLADCHHLSPLYTGAPPHDVMPQSRAAAVRALELDRDLAEAHTSLAYVTFSYDWDLARAEQGFRRAIELSPGYATAHQWRHELLTAAGRVAEQREAIERARQLDPLSPIIQAEVGWGLYHARDAGAAIAHLQRTVVAHPSFPVAWLVLGLAHQLAGDSRAALAALERGRLLQSPPLLLLGALGHAFARLGRRADVDAVRCELDARGDTPAADHAAALVDIGAGDLDAAAGRLRRAFAGRLDRMVYWSVDPLLDAVRDHAGLEDLRRTFDRRAAT